MKRKSPYYRYYWIIWVCLALLLAGSIFAGNPVRVEQIYSQGIYPYYRVLPHALFSWMPFSLGDLFYMVSVAWLVVLFILGIGSLVKRRWQKAGLRGLQLVSSLLILHHFFYLSWGLNYYRQPLESHYDLNLRDISSADYYQVLDTLVVRANALRSQAGITAGRDIERQHATTQLEQVMRRDTIFNRLWSTRYVSAKSPISSVAASYFTVAGYLNPFTQEVQVNQLIPWTAYPFTTIHELAHQRGIGFEDECNFIAFEILRDHPNPWFQYSAYYSALQSFLRELRFMDQGAFKTYLARLNSDIRKDMRAEQVFWERYQGPVNYIFGIFYNQYLQHNNQPEGLNRYGMMNRLIISWSKNEYKSN